MTTAAALIIGDEILSGKVCDTNTPLLIELLRDIGVQLCRVVYLCDSVDEIAAEVKACSEGFDAVITSGGVGPTHDDRTVEAVAQAFGVGVLRHPDVEAMIRAYWGERFTEAALRMADMPDGARLLYTSDGLLPLVVFRNIYILPGIPRLFQAKLGALKTEIGGRSPLVGSVYLRSDESVIAPILSRAAEELRTVKIGSYPRSEHEDHRVWVTIEAEDGSAVAAAVDRLLELLPDDDVVRVDRP